MILERRRSLLEEKIVYVPFICTVNIASDNYLLNLPFSGNSNINVDWGDGSKNSYSGNITNPGHTYISSGNYVINIEGFSTNMNSSSLSNSWALNLISIDQWGDLSLTSVYRACYGCTKLVSISAPLGNPNITDASYTFYNCTSLTTLPDGLFANNINVTNFSGAFQMCNKITAIPPGLFANNTAATNFYGTFSNCTSLTGIPSGLFDKNTEVTSFNDTFYNCTGLTGNIPPGLFDNNTKVTNFHETFLSCISLTGNIPPGLFDKNTAVTDFKGTFNGCYGLTGDIPSDLFDKNTAVTDFEITFGNCSKLTGTTPTTQTDTGLLELWDRSTYGSPYPDNIEGNNCFYGCTKLSNYSSIPDYWK